MKRSVIILLIILLMFSGIINCFSASADNTGIFSDLTLLGQLEDARLLESIEAYSLELDYRFHEGLRIARLMDGFGRKDSIKGQPVGAHELLYALGYKAMSIDDNSLLFRDNIFMDYYRVRTEKVLEEYRKSGNIDFKGFIGSGKNEFDMFLKNIQRDDKKADRIVLLLQDKLIDKMYSEDLKDKKGYFDKVLALRLASGSDRRNQSLYELMESRVRLKLLEELVNINKNALKVRLDSTKVVINADTSGILSFRYISDIEKHTVLDYTVYMTAGSSDYKLVLPLSRLAALYGKGTFTDKKGDERIVSRDSIWDKISAGAEGGLEVSLEEAYINEEALPGYDILAVIPESKAAVDINQLSEEGKRLESISKEAQKQAHEITRSLYALSSYLDMKDKGISNSLTSGFEAGRRAWLADLDSKLSHMNKLVAGSKPEEAGPVGFLGYIKQYADHSRQLAAAGLPEDRAVLAFRDTVLQFRQADEGLLWIIDMLYEMEYGQR